MEYPSVSVPLPPSVEQMILDICTKQSQAPPGIPGRQELATIGEDASLHILRKISSQTIRKTLEKFIIYMARNESPVSSPQKSQCLSPIKQSLGLSPLKQSPGNTIRKYYQPQEYLNGSPSSTSEKVSRQAHSPHLVALDELEFRKAFLILSYLGGNRLEDVISVDEIRRFEQLDMIEFERQVWNSFGYKCNKAGDRLKPLDWNSGQTHIYHCHVSSDGSYTFKGPFLDKQKTHLQRVLGDDSVLRVKFAEEATDKSSSGVGSCDYSSKYKTIFNEGILVGLRRYRFFVFKDGGKEEKKKNPTTSPVKCFFVCMESLASSDCNKKLILSNKTVYEARCLFMHAHMASSVQKYMARFSLILSKTIKLEVDLASVRIETIDDIPCRDANGSKVYNEDGDLCIHTDGTGFISEDLALRCPRNVCRGNHNTTSNFEKFLHNGGHEEKVSELQQSGSHLRDPPLLIQFRMFNNGSAVKGTLLVNRKLPQGTIQIRPSMIKVTPDSNLRNTPTANSLEVVGTSNQPKKKTYLSRYLIVLLTYGGVPESFFMDLLTNALEEAQSVHYKKHAAVNASLNYGDMDDFTIAQMILSGIPLDEPSLQNRLSILMKMERKKLKEGRLPISDSFYLMGTADPTGMLKSDEVCIILDNGQISGKVLVFKHPGLHFGDIHVLNARYVKEMEDFIGNAKYAIFFPTQGRRSLTDEMANSDLDGDMYFVSRNPELLKYYKPSDPWHPANSGGPAHGKKPTDFSPEELEAELFQLFMTTRFQPSKAMGLAADSWLTFMDRFLTLGDESADEKNCLKKKILQLIDIYYDALDAPKSGKKIEVPEKLKPKKYPHFMERDNGGYFSKSILGKIYDAVESFKMENPVMKEVWTLPCFNIELPGDCLSMWERHYENYRQEMSDALWQPEEHKNESADAVIKKYKQLLYGATDFEETCRNMKDIINEALAIYKVTYEYANKRNSASRCEFAWKVAGKPLCTFYAKEQGEKSVTCSVSVLREILL